MNSIKTYQFTNNKIKTLLMIGWTTITMNVTNGIWQNYHRQNTFNTALQAFTHYKCKCQAKFYIVANLSYRTHYKQTSSYMVLSIYELNDFTYVSKIKVH